ncbi:non-ribosomal peptide synthetase [Chitinophaga qingshengii]|uniref:Amino acid adenylation domain-containing protein n=1 Tax=Chitinophaga qingshengii TaxID=1569794 RepID=A0ABR7TXN8_9BACT|nr:non-ribosomal peptide synthetase [Chitinophaga qingshengii]MBC9934890.1 amino acid adenylation domain-containing protein [Chitinophaga qingshengii]
MANIFDELKNLSADQREMLKSRLREKGMKGMDAERITPAPSMANYPLSSAQKRMFTMYQIDPVTIVYNLPQALWLKGHLDVERLAHAFRQLVHRHEALRTSFHLLDDQLVQVVHPTVNFHLDYEVRDERPLTDEELDNTVAAFMQPFDFSVAPLFRAKLIRIQRNGEQVHLLLQDKHHIISDGISEEVLNTELAALYAGLGLSPVALHYKDYAVWQQQQLNKEWFQQQRRYWLDKFKGPLPVLDLPADFPRPRIKTFKGDTFLFQMDEQLTAGLKQLAAANSATLYVLLVAMFKTLLFRYTNENELIIASDTANRTRAELNGVVGMFINKLIIKSQPGMDMPFDVYLKQIREIFAEALENQDYQFDMLVQDINVPRDTSRNPVFDISMGFQNMDVSGIAPIALDVAPYTGKERLSARLDLHLDGIEKDGRLYFTFEYSTDLFRETTIANMARHFQQLAAAIVKDSCTTLGMLPLLGNVEKNHLIEAGNKGPLEYRKEALVHQIFEELVAVQPLQPAVQGGHEVLTYMELNKRANQLAHLLKSKGVCRDQPVAILADRSVETVIGILGILKAGACYLPIDSNHPTERIAYILEDAHAVIVLSTMNDTFLRIFSMPEFSDTEWIMLDDKSIFTGPTENLGQVNVPGDLAYIIYTSATTGQPKGVMLEHRGVLNLVANTSHTFGLTNADHILQFATMGFDASVFEIFTALLTGATLYMPSLAVIQEYSRFEQYLNDNNITMALLPPIYAQHLNPENIHSLRILFTGGSASNFELEKKWKTHLTYVNAYGPTETTVVASFFVSDNNISTESTYSSVPIGKPLYNTRLYVLDEYLQPVPVGFTGELCVAGDSVARGYLNREEMTAARFIDDPFGEGKMYRTGDIVKWTADLNLEFRGRVDDQVKIRGFRIETGEIEKALMQYPDIKEAVVLAVADPQQQGEKFLCAYYTGRKNLGAPLVTDAIKKHLEKSLPAYMIPHCLMQIEEMPLSLSGKIDSKLLPPPDSIIHKSSAADMVVSPLEEQLAGIWCEVLRKEKIGIHDNFFALGGDSIKAITLVSKLNKELDLDLVINNIFANQTVKTLAAFVVGQKDEPVDLPPAAAAYQALTDWQARQQSVVEKLGLGAYEDLYPMSDIQAGMFYHNLADPFMYHNHVVFEIRDDAFDLDALRDTIARLVQKHGIFRAAFYLDAFESPAIVVASSLDLSEKIFYHDLDHLPGDQQQSYMQDFMNDDLRQGLDWKVFGLWRIVVFKLSASRHAVLLGCHHAIMDGWSDAVFLTEISQVYQTIRKDLPLKLEPLHCSYKDFVADQWRYKQAPAVRQFWATQLDGYERLPLPFDRKAATADVMEKDYHYFYPEKELEMALLEFAQQNEMSLKHICLAAYLCLLQLTTGKQDLTIGVLCHGRPELEDAEKMLGCFLNSVPFRVKFDKMLYAREILDLVKQASDLQQGFDKLPLVDIVQAAGEKSAERNPLFDVFFSYLNFHVYEQAEAGMELSSASRGFGVSNTLFDIMIEYYDSLTISFHYVKGLYTNAEIKRLEEYYLRLLYRLVTYPKEVIHTKDVMSAEEVKNVQVTFNDVGPGETAAGSVVEQFLYQVRRLPGNTALVAEGRSLTYLELNTKANQLAALLIQKGIRRDTPVVLLGTHSAETIIGMLGILKAGGCYVPVDLNYPLERLRMIATESGAGIAIACGYREGLILPDQELINIADALQGDITHEPPLVNKADDLAYIIYTSGTTGTPKGVMVSHDGIIRLVINPNYIELNEQTRILPTCAISFDVSTFEIWGALLNGGTLFLLSRDELLDQSLLKECLTANAINTMWFTTSWFNQLADTAPDIFSGLKYLLVGGEKLSPAHIARIRNLFAAKGLRIINGYGPTENTAFSACYQIDQDFEFSIPLGYPVSGSQVYILDAHRQLVPVGVPGEIYLAGRGLARGYHRRPDLTEEKFGVLYLDAPVRVYASGDIGFWQPDGTVAFIGRKDEQVKIRGHRIELEEIEQTLLHHPEVANAAVTVFTGEQGNRSLIAYIVGKEGKIPVIADVKRYLLNLLPDFMLPAQFILLDTLPLTSNGKINKAALPPPGTLQTANYQAARNETEQMLVNIWEQVLGISPVSIFDNFFELGGHSLKASLLVTRISNEGPVNITPRDIFRNPTIELLAEEIGKRKWMHTGTMTAGDDAAFKIIDL